MVALPSCVRVRRVEQTAAVQIVGRGTQNQCSSLRRWVEQALESGATSVEVDLRHCTFLDSTFMGTLLCLRSAAAKAAIPARFWLVAPSVECCRHLRQMGLLRLFSVVERDDPDPGEWTELDIGTDDVLAFKQHVVEAHRELARLGGPAAELYRHLIGPLTYELESARAK